MRKALEFIFIITVLLSALPVNALAEDRDFCSVNIVLDPGHGGEDGGAVAPDGTLEADINLEIVLIMRDILGLYGLEPVLTRDSAELSYPADVVSIREKKVWDQRCRLAMIDNTPNALLVSVHQNQYSAPSAKGAEVLYAPTDGSNTLAVWLQTLIVTEIDPQNNRTEGQISEDIWLMNHVHCPAVLVECGFLSNPAELDLLKNKTYQRNFAAVLVSGLLTWTDTHVEYGGIFHGENSVFLH